MTTDPVELELFRNLFEAAAEEMGITLQRVAFSANIKERRDFSCALFDAEGWLLAQAAHIPVHLGSMPASVRAVLEALGRLGPGQTAVVNDPFAGGTHLPDVTLVTPIYHGEELVGYAANRAHHADVGGATPGSMTLSRHIDEEGYRIGPSLLTEELVERFASATRTPEERRGDLEAQLAANRVGVAAMGRIVERNGLETVRHYAGAILGYSQAFMARVIREIPDGVYAFDDFLDDDGAGGRMLPVRVTLTVSGERVTADFGGSADQTAGCVNCPAAVTASAVYYCFACLLPEGVPLNEGCFRNIEVVTRVGALLDAAYPAAVVAGNTETSQRVVDVVLGALSKALPGRVPAASCGTMSSVAMGGDGWTYYETIGGGSGAGPAWAGEPAVQCHMTNTLNTPAEALELQYPLRVVAYEILANGGAGRHDGGGGIRRVIETLVPCEGTLLADRRVTRSYGLAGGGDGEAGVQFVHAGESKALPGKVRFRLNAGERLEIRTPGGGGWGEAG